MSIVEKETKLVISEADYGRLRRVGPILEEKDQLNVYFHDPARLAETLGYLRVRFETGREPVATLKIPAGWTGDMRKMVEVERPLADMGPSLFPRPRRWVSVEPPLPEDFLKHLRAMGIGTLKRLGWMRNHRSVMEVSELGTVELDSTTLPGGGLHHEVEIENPGVGAHQALVEKVREMAPSARISRKGKFSRFLAATGSS